MIKNSPCNVGLKVYKEDYYYIMEALAAFGLLPLTIVDETQDPLIVDIRGDKTFQKVSDILKARCCESAKLGKTPGYNKSEAEKSTDIHNRLYHFFKMFSDQAYIFAQHVYR